ncbi:diiron oxygenase [Nocardioides sp. AE5]|uniref:AurF N-oxygenase family protein n=1 Tax=Nocardioides sp. AE5 TaxID=2962573 RepID=UPI0028820FDC|nr:diiron oxygenase [Nocardioides sp. AE5]MDT0200936.1 diiron oxygenase [Nocardioides sp. AE5]
MTTTAQANSSQTYEEKLQTLSEASVHQHFDAFVDIDWDNPDYAIHHDDPRWILPEADVLGRHPWYQAQSRERQIEIGLLRQANVTKVGLQFEQVLIGGIMQHAFSLPNGSPEFRYSTHEATEECHHTQMFQEFVNRAGVDVPGGNRFFRTVAPFLPLAAAVLPEVFFVGVLAGEEPIDHVQKSILRAGDDLHPLLQRIMQIHVAEEARHIGFAHEYLAQRIPELSGPRKALLSVLYPVIMRTLCDIILVPGKEITDQMGMPRSVIRDVYWKQPESQKVLRDIFGDVRMLAEETKLMNPVSRLVWKLCRIDGRPSRFRSEPASAAA